MEQNVYLPRLLLFYSGVFLKLVLCLQVASRALDIPVDQIHFSETSSGVIPNSTPTAASGGTDLNGAAVLVQSFLC